MIFLVQPIAIGPAKTWIAGFKKSDHESIFKNGGLHEALLQEFSWGNSKQYRGFADLAEDIPWWKIGGHKKISPEYLEEIVVRNIDPLVKHFKKLFPGLI